MVMDYILCTTKFLEVLLVEKEEMFRSVVIERAFAS
jgi:hypothetical protein